MQLGRKLKVFAVFVVLGGIVAAWQGLRYWYNYGYSTGTKTGTLRKIAVTGPPYCKYLLGEMALVGGAPGQPAEIWQFSVDDERDANPLIKELHQAERAAKPVTLKYRQDRALWWRCAPTEYYVTGVEP